MSPDDEDHGGDGDGGDGGAGGANESFAELIGDVRPLKDGAERVPTPTSSLPRAARRADEASAPTTRFRWPDPAQRGCAAASGVNDQRLFDLGRGHPAPEERIDLHGLRRDTAPRVLRQRLASAVGRHLGCVLIIHGQGKNSPAGEAILRERVPDWLTSSPNAEIVLAFSPAPARLGGDGATLVLLKQR